jgi:hypothetical protein
MLEVGAAVPRSAEVINNVTSDAEADFTTCLMPQHRKLVLESAISEEVARARGYQSVTTKVEMKRRGFGDAQARVPALMIPVWGVTGEIVNYQVRPDEPRLKEGKQVKYETPARSRMALDINPRARAWLKDISRPLFITEGIRKGDAAVSKGLCCVALLGVWNWRGRHDGDGLAALADWEWIALNEREVYVCFDSDVMEKPPVAQALKRLRGFLERRGAKVKVIYLPPTHGGAKQGLDDFFAAGNSVQSLLSHATSELRNCDGGEEEAAEYEATERGMVWNKPMAGGSVPTLLTNYTGRIVTEVVEDDGTETQRKFEIEAQVGCRPSVTVHVPAAKFGSMHWVTEQLGAQAVTFPGMGERAKCAIQIVSTDIQTRRVFTHTGWRCEGGEWVYLHGDGAVGSAGAVPLEVDLPDNLRPFRLPEPPDGDALKAAIRASLLALHVAPIQVTAPVLGAAFAAVLGGADYTVHLAGTTGAGKTELGTLVQQHFGAEFDSRRPPASWSSTGNSLEGTAHVLKDAVLLVDDFAPTGSSYDVARSHRDADRILRAQGNHSGRMRMRPDGTIRPEKPPRGLILSTGEDVPKGHSLRARTLVVETTGDTLNWSRMTARQDDARAGLYAQAMSGFLRWLAPRYEALRGSARSELALLRDSAATSLRGHRRTPNIVAHLYRGWGCFLDAAVETGALSTSRADRYRGRIWDALLEIAKRQAEHHITQEPATRFVELLIAAITSGRAHLTALGGGMPFKGEAGQPITAENAGWRYDGGEFVAKGDHVGWVDGEDVYLQPDASVAVARRMAGSAGDDFTITAPTLWKRMHERGMLASTEEKRETLKVRRKINGRRMSVIHVRTALVLEGVSCGETPDQPDHGEVGGACGQRAVLDERSFEEMGF